MTNSKAKLWIPWACLYVAVIGLTLWTLAYERPIPASVLTLTQATLTQGPNVPTKLNSAESLSVTLPNNWRTRPPTSQSEAFYELSFDLDELPDELWGLSILSHRSNAAVYVNGTFIGDGGRFESPVSRNWMNPVLFSISQKLLVQGKNTVQIQLVTEPVGLGFLDVVYVGPHIALKSLFSTVRFLRITLAQIITALMFVMAIGIGLIWLARPQDKTFGYFSLSTFFWALHNLNVIVINIPTSFRVWEILAFCSVIWYAIFGALFAHSFLDIKRPLLERAVLIFGLLSTLLMAILPRQWFYLYGQFILSPAELLIGCYAILIIMRHAWIEDRQTWHIIAAAGLAIIIYGFHDILVLANVITDEVVFYVQYAAIFIVGGFGLLLLKRHTDALTDFESLAQTLEERIRRKELELKEGFDRQSELEKRQVLDQERQRLTREMHDGLGGQLVSLLALTKQDNLNKDSLGDALQDALDELRLTIKSLDVEEDDLPSLLGTFRERIEPRLRDCGIGIDWNVDAIPPLPGFTSKVALNILRIMQEAVTNIIKHSGATRIRFSLSNQTAGDMRKVKLSNF